MEGPDRRRRIELIDGEDKGAADGADVVCEGLAQPRRRRSRGPFQEPIPPGGKRISPRPAWSVRLDAGPNATNNGVVLGKGLREHVLSTRSSDIVEVLRNVRMQRSVDCAITWRADRRRR